MLTIQARIGDKEDIRNGFLGWLLRFNVVGDDGGHYSLGGPILPLAEEKLDLVQMDLTTG